MQEETTEGLVRKSVERVSNLVEELFYYVDVRTGPPEWGSVHQRLAEIRKAVAETERLLSILPSRGVRGKEVEAPFSCPAIWDRI